MQPIVLQYQQLQPLKCEDKSNITITSTAMETQSPTIEEPVSDQDYCNNNAESETDNLIQCPSIHINEETQDLNEETQDLNEETQDLNEETQDLNEDNKKEGFTAIIGCYESSKQQQILDVCLTEVVKRPIKSLIPPDADEKPYVRSRMDWNDYHRLDVIHAFMDDLEYDYPSICTTGVIGKSLEGRDMKILKVSNSDASNVSIWMDAGIHAREWIAPATATFLANHIVKNFDTLPTYITNKDWYFLPVVNPDGYEYSHLKDRMWRKNRAWYGNRCVGVDLNRNFSYGWGCKGSSSKPNNAFYRGPQPFSEPESSAVKDMISSSGISFTVYLTLHSYGQVILFPFAFQEEVCPDYVRLLQGATVMSRAIYDTTKNTYKVGISRDVMYGAAGTSNDWSYGEVGIPFCYLIELRSKKHKFNLPREEIEETGNEILSGVFALMEFIDNYTEPKFGNGDVHLQSAGTGERESDKELELEKEDG